MSADGAAQPRCVMFPHRPTSIGGPSSFQARFERVLGREGWRVAYAGEPGKPHVVFIVGGTRRLWWVLRMKRQGARVVLRLDGMYWQFRSPGTPLRQKALGLVHNWYAALLRRWVADVVVYQSDFVVEWWRRAFGEVPARQHRIHNGVNTAEFCPGREPDQDSSEPRVICVEGNLGGSSAVHILRGVEGYRVDLYGRVVDPALREVAARRDQRIRLMGPIAREQVPHIYHGRCVFLSLDINAACPNAVIEAMACGVPVLGFDSGSLRELVGEDAGVIMPFGGDPWRGDLPDTRYIGPSVRRILDDYGRYCVGARARAVQEFDIQQMARAYLGILDGGTGPGNAEASDVSP